MALDELGKQVVIISELAFNRLHFENFEIANSLEYFIKRKTRDEKARIDYLDNIRNSNIITNDLFVIDIIRRGLKDGDKII